MLKKDETTDESSCLNRAREDEMLFVLLGRDRAAPAAIRAWIGERLRLRMNAVDDEQITQAEQAALVMEGQQRAMRAAKEVGRCLS